MITTYTTEDDNCRNGNNEFGMARVGNHEGVQEWSWIVRIHHH